MSLPTAGNYDADNEGGSTKTSTTRTKPVGLADGDALLLVIYKENTNAITWPTGFVEQEMATSGSMFGAVATKVITDAASEPATYTASWSGSVFVGSFLGVVKEPDTSALLSGTITFATGNSGTINSPSMTTLDNDCLVLDIKWDYDWVSISTATGTTFWGSTDPSNESIQLCWFSQVTAGATGDKTSTVATTDWIGMQIAFKGPATGTQTISPTSITTGENIGDGSLSGGAPMPTAALQTIRGTAVISASATTATITEGVDYTLPTGADSTTCFIRLTNGRYTGMGQTSGGGNQNLDDFTVYISNPANIATSITFTRQGSANDCRVDWEILCYVGTSGAGNEMIVRGIGTVSGTAVTLTGTTLTNISNNNDCVVFITGQATNDAGRSDWHSCLFTPNLVINGSDYDPQFNRDSTATAATAYISYAVIEFIGANWTIDRVDFTDTGAVWAAGNAISFTYAHGVTISDLAKAFLITFYSTSNDDTGLDDAGDSVQLGTSNLTIWNRATTGTRRKVCYIIQNSQEDGSARNLTVQQVAWSDDTTSGAEERSFVQTITAVADVDESSLFLSVSVDGSGTGLPRGAINYRLTDVTTITLTESDNGQERRFGGSVVAWPQDPPTATSQTITPTGMTSDEVVGSQSLDAGVVALAPNGVVTDENMGTAVAQAGTVVVDPTRILSGELVGNTTLVAGLVSVAPAGIASSETIETHTLFPGAATIVNSGIPSEETVGTAVLSEGSVTIIASSIAGGELFGVHIVQPQSIVISPSSLASEEVVGTAVLQAGLVQLLVNGIASQEEIGTVSLITQAMQLLVNGIVSQEGIGVHTLTPQAVIITVSSLISEELLGTAVLSAGGTVIQPTGVGSDEMIGNLLLQADVISMLVNSVASAEEPGAHLLQISSVTLHPSSIIGIGGELIGTAVLGVGPVSLLPNSLASLEAIGTALLSSGTAISPAAVESFEAIGTVVLQAGMLPLLPSAIDSLEQIGNYLFSAGGASLLPLSITSEEVIATAVLQAGSIALALAGIASGEVVPSPTLSAIIHLQMTGIATDEMMGTVVLQIGSLLIQPTGVLSAEAVNGAIVIPAQVSIHTTGIGTQTNIPAPTILAGSLFLTPAGIASLETMGTHALASGTAVLRPITIASSEMIGTAVFLADGSFIGVIYLSGSLDIEHSPLAGALDISIDSLLGQLDAEQALRGEWVEPSLNGELVIEQGAKGEI